MSGAKIAVIGIGNSLRRDDGIGITILESLLKHYKRPGVEYLNFGIASFDLIHRLGDYKKVLLVDALSAGLPAGDLKIFELKEISWNTGKYIMSPKELAESSGRRPVSFAKENRALSSHELNLKDIFELSRKFKIKAKIFVAGIQAKDVSFGESLSGPLKQKLENNIKAIDEFIRGKLCGK